MFPNKLNLKGIISRVLPDISKIMFQSVSDSDCFQIQTK
jgi:hypothetical protein